MSLKTQFTKCKVTGQKIPIIFNFGKMPIANNFSNKVDKKNMYEMKIAFNESNGLFQLVSAPKPKKLFNDSYEFKKIKPKYCFLFAWNHYKEIFKKEKKNKIKWFCHIDRKHFPKNHRKNFI